jgi:predicted dehydrogenase
MIRYGLLGFGHHCVRRLIPAFADAQTSMLTGLWRRDLQKAAANARDYSIEHVFATPEELCASPAIDAVFVTSPDALHLPHVLLALAHGKPVLCEKPLGMRAGEVEEMLAAASAAEQCLGVAQNFRFNTSLEVIRDWVAAGRIEQPALAHAQFCYTAETSPRQWIYDAALACGGPIGDVGIHCIDALRFVLGANVTAVNALARADAASAPLEAYAAIGLDFTGSAVGSVTVSTRGAYRSHIEVTGQAGAILCANGFSVDQNVDVLLLREGNIADRKTVSNADGYTRMLDSFSNWVEGHSEFRATGADGLHNQQVLDAAYTSWHTGLRQTLPSQLT